MDLEGDMVNRRPVTVEELGRTRSDPAPVRWIVFPSFVPGSRAELLPMSRSEAMFRLAGECLLNIDVWRMASLDSMAAEVVA
jgi:hypothetical protein